MTVSRGLTQLSHSLRINALITSPSKSRLQPIAAHLCNYNFRVHRIPTRQPIATAPRELVSHKYRSISILSYAEKHGYASEKVEASTLEAIEEKYPNCHPEINPFDLYRAHLADVLAKVTGVDTKIIYPQLAWTVSLDKGDLVLAAPALRIKGKKPDELAKEWAEKVSPASRLSSCSSLVNATADGSGLRSFRMTPCSRSLPFLTTSCPSSSRVPR